MIDKHGCRSGRPGPIGLGYVVAGCDASPSRFFVGEPIRTLESCHVKYVPKPLTLKIVPSGRELRRRGLDANRRGAILRALESRVDRVEVVPRPASRTNRDRSCRTCRSPWRKHIALNSTIPVSSAAEGSRTARRQARIGAGWRELRAWAISARTGAPEMTASTMVREVCTWPRALICRTGTLAAASASA